MKKISNERMIAALQKAKGLIYRASRNLKCHPLTIYRRIKECEDVAAALEIERGLSVDEAESRLNLAVKKNHEWAIKMVLRCLGADRGYGDKVDGGSSGAQSPAGQTPPPPGEPGYNVWVIVEGPQVVQKPTALPEPPPPVSE